MSKKSPIHKMSGETGALSTPRANFKFVKRHSPQFQRKIMLSVFSPLQALDTFKDAELTTYTENSPGL